MKQRDWLKLAERDMKLCGLLEEKLPEKFAETSICFHVQQAVEKVMKGLLEGRITVPSTSDIGVLLQLCKENGIDGLSDMSLTTAATLTEWGDNESFHRFNKQIYRKAMEIY